MLGGELELGKEYQGGRILTSMQLCHDQAQNLELHRMVCETHCENAPQAHAETEIGWKEDELWGWLQSAE